MSVAAAKCMTFEELVAEAERRPTTGWDFSWLGGRMTTTPLPWDFTELVVERTRLARDMLDMGTGGGEWLAGLPNRPLHTVATEAWKPNVPVARERLGPLGIDVVEIDGAPDNTAQERGERGGDLPFADRSFDLVTNRHESFAASEVARVLRPGGVFMTQQLGDGIYREFNELLGAEVPGDDVWRLPLAVEQVERAGLSVTGSAEGYEYVTFADVGALAWYLRMVPWTVPGFSVGEYRDKLRELHEQIGSTKPITIRLPGFYLEARRRSTSSATPRGSSMS
jgi:SAM-dependent methyltransferase